MKIIYPIEPEDVQKGDWIDWDTPNTHHHDQVIEVTPIRAGRRKIETSNFYFIGDFAEFHKAVISRVVDDSYKPKPKVPTEPGFYRDKIGALWAKTKIRGAYGLTEGAFILHPSPLSDLPKCFAPYTRVKFVDCEES